MIGPRMPQARESKAAVKNLLRNTEAKIYTNMLRDVKARRRLVGVVRVMAKKVIMVVRARMV